MSIEQALAENTAALVALTAALKAGGTAAAATPSPAPAPAAGKAGKGKAAEENKAYQPKHTKDEMIAALTELKEAKGLPEAKKVIKEVGKKDKMGEIDDPATIDAVYEAAKKAVGGDDEGDGDGL